MLFTQWLFLCCFFFSSRRRHTRWNCDWSSDVCSSDLYDQIPLIKEMLDAFNVAIFEKEGYETDDIIGTLTRATQNYADRYAELRGTGVESIIVTGDLDALQLVNENTKVCALKQGISEIVMYD